MKGYYVGYGFMGYVNGRYRLFASEAEYIEYIDEDNSEETFSQWGSVETIRFPSETMMI